MYRVYLELTERINNLIQQTSHKRFDITILSSGTVGLISEWFLENWHSVAYFLLFGVGVMIMKVIKFNEDIRHIKRTNDLIYQKKLAELDHFIAMNKIEENDSKHK